MAKIDTQVALDLRLNHDLSFNRIAKQFGCSPQAIQQKLKPLLPTPATYAFKEQRADILSEAQLKILLNLDAKRLKAASANNLAYAFKELWNCERLERGMSTGHIVSIIADIKAIREMEATSTKEKE